MSYAAQSSLADEIAAEHIAWCRSQGQTLRTIMRSIGIQAAVTPDEAHDAIATIWLYECVPWTKCRRNGISRVRG